MEIARIRWKRKSFTLDWSRGKTFAQICRVSDSKFVTINCIYLSTLYILAYEAEFPCWKRNINALILGCYMESHKLRRSMELLTQNASTHVLDLVCQDLNILAICSISDYFKYCGSNTKVASVCKSVN